MAIRFMAVTNEMEFAAKKLEKEADAFRIAIRNTRSAAERLTSNWEGDARETFVAEQEEAIRWYEEMTDLVTEYKEKVRRAAEEYAATDHQCADILRAV